MRGWTNAVSGSQLNLDADYHSFCNVTSNELIESKSNVDLIFKDFNTSQVVLSDANIVDTWVFNDSKAIVVFTNTSKPYKIYAMFLNKQQNQWTQSNRIEIGVIEQAYTSAFEHENCHIFVTKSNKLVVFMTVETSSNYYTNTFITAQINNKYSNLSNIHTTMYSQFTTDMFTDDIKFIFEINTDVIIYLTKKDNQFKTLNISNISSPKTGSIGGYLTESDVLKISSTIIPINDNCILYVYMHSKSTQGATLSTILCSYKDGKYDVKQQLFNLPQGTNYANILYYYIENTETYCNIYMSINSQESRYYDYGDYVMKIDLQNYNVNSVVKRNNESTSTINTSRNERYLLYFDNYVLVYGDANAIYGENKNILYDIYLCRNDKKPISIFNSPNIKFYYDSKMTFKKYFNNKNFLNITSFTTLGTTNINIYSNNSALQASKNKYGYSPFYNKEPITQTQPQSIYIRYNSKV